MRGSNAYVWQPFQTSRLADARPTLLKHHLHWQASGVIWGFFRNCLKLVSTFAGDHGRHERIEYVVPGDDFPQKPGTSRLIYLLGPRLDSFEDSEAFSFSLRFLLAKLHGPSVIQRPETELRMHFPDRWRRTRVTRQHQGIDFSDLGRYRKRLNADPSPGKTALDLQSAAIVFWRCRRLFHGLTSRRREDTRPATTE